MRVRALAAALVLALALAGCASRNLFGRSTRYVPPSRMSGYTVKLCLSVKPGPGLFYAPLNADYEAVPIGIKWCSYEEMRKDISSFFNLACYGEESFKIAGTEVGKPWRETVEDVFRYYMRPYDVEIHWWPECPEDSIVVKGEIKPRIFRPFQCKSILKTTLMGMMIGAVLPFYGHIWYAIHVNDIDDIEKWFQEIFDGEIEYGGKRIRVLASLPIDEKEILPVKFRKGKGTMHCLWNGDSLSFCVVRKNCKRKMCRDFNKWLKKNVEKDEEFSRKICKCKSSEEIEKFIKKISILGEKGHKKPKLAMQFWFGCIKANTSYILGIRNAALVTKWFIMKKITGDTDPKLDEMMEDEGITSPDNLVAKHSIELYDRYWGKVEQLCPKVYKYGRISVQQWWDTRMQYYRDLLPDECYLTVERKHSCWEYWTDEDFAKYPRREKNELIIEEEKERKKRSHRESESDDFDW